MTTTILLTGTVLFVGFKRVRLFVLCFLGFVAGVIVGGVRSQRGVEFAGDLLNFRAGGNGGE